MPARRESVTHKDVMNERAVVKDYQRILFQRDLEQLAMTASFILHTEKHHSGSPLNELVCQWPQTQAWRADTMNKQDLGPLFRPKLINSAVSKRRHHISGPWKLVWLVCQLCRLFGCQPRQQSLKRRLGHRVQLRIVPCVVVVLQRHVQSKRSYRRARIAEIRKRPPSRKVDCHSVVA
jgi:hypothetical protein